MTSWVTDELLHCSYIHTHTHLYFFFSKNNYRTSLFKRDSRDVRIFNLIIFLSYLFIYLFVYFFFFLRLHVVYHYSCYRHYDYIPYFPSTLYLFLGNKLLTDDLTDLAKIHVRKIVCLIDTLPRSKT